jgi:hypothetical protein
MLDSISRRLAITLLATVALAANFCAADDKEAPDVKLVQGSVWKGSIHPDARQAKGKTRGATLKITGRDGTTFDATYIEVGQNRRSLEMKGQVDKNGGLHMKPTKVIAGAWGDHVLDKTWLGHVNGENLTLKVVTGDNGANSQGDEAELTLKS